MMTKVQEDALRRLVSTIDDLRATNAALLEALQKITERFADVHRHNDDGWGSFRDMELIDVANEAIRKATE